MAFLPQNPLGVFLFCFFTPPWMCRQGSDCQAYRAFKTHLLLLFFNSHCRVSVLIDGRISRALLALVTTRLPGRDPHMLGVLGSPYMDVFCVFCFLERCWRLLAVNMHTVHQKNHLFQNTKATTNTLLNCFWERLPNGIWDLFHHPGINHFRFKQVKQKLIFFKEKENLLGTGFPLSFLWLFSTLHFLSPSKRLL